MHVDKLLMKSNGTTMLELWGGNEEINQVTIYDLLHMTGGLRDYNDKVLREWTWTHPDEDYTPLDYIYSLNKKFYCKPGTDLHYSSNGYELLGLVLA